MPTFEPTLLVVEGRALAALPSANGQHLHTEECIGDPGFCSLTAGGPPADGSHLPSARSEMGDNLGHEILDDENTADVTIDPGAILGPVCSSPEPEPAPAGANGVPKSLSRLAYQFDAATHEETEPLAAPEPEAAAAGHDASGAVAEHGAAVKAALDLKALCGEIPPNALKWVLAMYKDTIKQQMTQIKPRFSPKVILAAVEAVFATEPTGSPCSHPVPPDPVPPDIPIDGEEDEVETEPEDEEVEGEEEQEAEADIHGLAMWNDRHNWCDHEDRDTTTVRQLVHKMVAKHPILHRLLKHRLNDPDATIFIYRPEQSGKTLAVSEPPLPVGYTQCRYDVPYREGCICSA